MNLKITECLVIKIQEFEKLDCHREMTWLCGAGGIKGGGKEEERWLERVWTPNILLC
jgi:hypothetical protein